MGTYVVWWNADRSDIDRVIDALTSAADDFPELGDLKVETVLTAGSAGLARLVKQDKPTNLDDDAFVHIEGLPILRNEGRVLAAREATSADPSLLDGQFALIRGSASGLEVTTDPLGFSPVFTAETHDGAFVSNSVGVLARSLHLSQIDQIAAAEFISRGGQLMSFRTMCSGISRLPGGTRFSWSNHDAAPRSTTYFGPSNATRTTGRGSEIGKLAAELKSNMHAVAALGHPIDAPLTAGLDSRLIAAILLGAEIDAHYFTSSADSGDNVDVSAGLEIAEQLALSHKLHERPTDMIVNRWKETRDRILALGQGSISLWQAAGVIWDPSEVRECRITLTGLGGELARSPSGAPHQVLAKRRRAIVEQFVSSRSQNVEGLLADDALHEHRSYLRSFAADQLEHGSAASQIGELFFVFVSMPAWAGAQSLLGPRTHLPHAPLACRAFVEETFARSRWHRYGERIHRDLIEELSPVLAMRSSQRGYWRAQGLPDMPRHVIAALKASRSGRRFEKAADHDPSMWMAALIADYIPFVEESAGSAIWDVVAIGRVRSWLDRVDSLTRREVRDLFSVLTVLEYERHLAN